VIEQKKSLASELVHLKYLVIVLEQIVIFSDYSKLHWKCKETRVLCVCFLVI
jgi:hypothetical protein